MAAHDDKISNNRRRLFKALSAAPVVATLRPGEALANASVQQCLANSTNPRNLANADACVTGDANCWAYEAGKEFWLGAEADIRRPGRVTPDMSVVTDPNAVILQSAVDSTQFYLWDEGALTATLIVFTTIGVFLEVGPQGNFLRVRRPNNAGTIIRTVIRFPTREGVALRLFDPIDKNGVSTPGNSTSSPPVDAIVNPNVVPDAWSGMPTNPNLQGVAATCLTTVDPNGSLTNFVLNKG